MKAECGLANRNPGPRAGDQTLVLTALTYHTTATNALPQKITMVYFGFLASCIFLLSSISGMMQGLPWSKRVEGRGAEQWWRSPGATMAALTALLALLALAPPPCRPASLPSDGEVAAMFIKLRSHIAKINQMAAEL